VGILTLDPRQKISAGCPILNGAFFATSGWGF
jgi:hypothetical protein